MRVRTVVIATACALCACGAAWASETITYSYNGRGMMNQVSRSGDVNNNVVTKYQYDDSDNRTNVKTTGSTNSPPS